MGTFKVIAYRLLKISGIFAASVVAIFLFVANFSTVPSSYECQGKVTLNGVKTSEKIFIRLERYRWWVGLWSSSDGSLHLQIPNELTTYFSDLSITKTQVIIRDDVLPIGVYQLLSRSFSIQVTRGYYFEGACIQIAN